MARYAEGTQVTVAKSIDQIRTLLLRAGATHYAYGEGPDEAGVQFALGGLHYKFSFLVLPDGRTLGDWAEPQVEQMYAGGTMPPLLSSGNDR